MTISEEQLELWRLRLEGGISVAYTIKVQEVLDLVAEVRRLQRENEKLRPDAEAHRATKGRIMDVLGDDLMDGSWP